MPFFRIIKITIFLIIAPNLAYAMPFDNDEQYVCRSASGNYQIKAQTGMYDKNLRVLEVKINKVNRDIGLGDFHYWNGDRYLAFRYNLGSNGEGYSIVVEFDHVSKSGTLKYQYRDYNPGNWVTKKEEAVNCVKIAIE